MQNTFSHSGNDSKWFLTKIIFQNRYVALETGLDPPPFMANAILNFHFDFLNPSLRLSDKHTDRQTDTSEDSSEEYKDHPVDKHRNRHKTINPNHGLSILFVFLLVQGILVIHDIRDTIRQEKCSFF